MLQEVLALTSSTPLCLLNLLFPSISYSCIVCLHVRLVFKCTMKLFKRNFKQTHWNIHFNTTMTRQKKNTLAFHRARPVITSPPFVKFSLQLSTLGESSTCGQNGTTERCQYYGWWLKSCTASHVSYTRVGGFSLWPLNFNFGFTWKVVQDFSHSEIPMFHVLHHHNVKIEGAGETTPYQKWCKISAILRDKRCGYETDEITICNWGTLLEVSVSVRS